MSFRFCQIVVFTLSPSVFSLPISFAAAVTLVIAAVAFSSGVVRAAWPLYEQMIRVTCMW